jgi:hypothetical protein
MNIGERRIDPRRRNEKDEVVKNLSVTLSFEGETESKI